MRIRRHHHAFTREWFADNLRWLCRAFNAPILGRWMRGQMGLTQEGRVVDVRPDSIVVQFNEKDYQYNGWTGDVISQFIYEIGKPLWWALHYWDEFIADRWIPDLSYGFNTLDGVQGGNQAGPPLLRQFTNPDTVTTNAWDLCISANGTSFTSVRRGLSGTTYDVWRGTIDNPTDLEVSRSSTTSSSVYIFRTFLHFNTSAMAGNRGQNKPGTLNVTWASVIVVPRASQSFNPSPLVLCQSTISPTKTSSNVVGTDFNQTPVTSPIDLATTQSNGTTNPPRDVNNAAFALAPGQSVPVQGTLNPNNQCYQWILKESVLTEIDSYYYPPSIEPIGAHNGLARFCLRNQVEFINGSDGQESINLIYSRERAEFEVTADKTVPRFFAPRLMVNYSVNGFVVDPFSIGSVDQNGIPSPIVTQFGKPKVDAPRVVQPRSITVNGLPATRFGLPTIPPIERRVEPRSLLLATKIGRPLIPVIFARGLNAQAQFGRPTVIGPILPIGIAPTTNINAPYIDPGNPRIISVGFKSLPEGTSTQPGRFGLARIDTGIYEIKPRSIEPATQFGLRGAIGHPFPEEVYISRLQDLPLQYQTVSFEYDGGRIENNVQVCGLRQWRLEYEGLSEADVALLVAHFNKVQGRVGLFPFYHRRDDVTYENCRYAAFDLPARLKKWANAVTITIEREE